MQLPGRGNSCLPIFPYYVHLASYIRVAVTRCSYIYIYIHICTYICATYTYTEIYIRKEEATAGMRIKGAFKGCLRFCGRPAISLRTLGVRGASEFRRWFMDSKGNRVGTKGTG